MQPIDDGVRMFVRFRGKLTGPFTMTQLYQKRDLGQLTPLHEVSLDGVNWQSAVGIILPAPSAPAGGKAPGMQPEANYPLQGSSVVPVQQQANQAPWYYLDAARQSQGPVSREQLGALIAQGSVTGKTQIWSETTGNWVSVEQSELAGYLPAVSGNASFAEVAGTGQPASHLQQQAGGPALVIGYVCAGLSFVLPPLGLGGLICGVLQLGNQKVGHGVAQILVSLFGTIIGVTMYILIYLALGESN